MFEHQSKQRVLYADTDQMGVVYYGNYARFFEVGRVEALRSLGFSYRDIENQGVMLPVLSMQVKYIAPAVYDEVLTIHTKIDSLPTSRIRFKHEIYNQAEQVLTSGEVILAFVDAQTRRPRRCPHDLQEAFQAFF